jgi:hypothetical protein
MTTTLRIHDACIRQAASQKWLFRLALLYSAQRATRDKVSDLATQVLMLLVNSLASNVGVPTPTDVCSCMEIEFTRTLCTTPHCTPFSSSIHRAPDNRLCGSTATSGPAHLACAWPLRGFMMWLVDHIRHNGLLEYEHELLAYACTLVA